MSTLKERVSNSDWREYLYFFEFYYYVLKRSPKKYNIAHGNSKSYISIIMTPIVLFLISMIVFTSVGHGLATAVFIGLGVSVLLNWMFALSVISEAYEIQRKLDDERREMEKEERRKKLDEEARQKVEALRQFNEDLERRMKDEAKRRAEQRRNENARRHAEQQRNEENKLKQQFTLLGIKPTKDIDVIKKAYRRKSKKHHPDVKGGNEMVFMEIKNAYDMIVEFIESKAKNERTM